MSNVVQVTSPKIFLSKISIGWIVNSMRMKHVLTSLCYYPSIYRVLIRFSWPRSNLSAWPLICCDLRLWHCFNWLGATVSFPEIVIFLSFIYLCRYISFDIFIFFIYLLIFLSFLCIFWYFYLFYIWIGDYSWQFS